MIKTASIKTELGDVFSLFTKEYFSMHKVSLQQRRTVFAIENCRTSVLGGHIDKCDSCHHKRISYNSCRNRHCPKCQQLDKEKWIEKLSCMMMPISHFHLVFTLPSELNNLCLSNQKLMYNLLFKATSQTILQLSSDKNNLGVETGMISILHTWGQNLMDHPHLHVLVPAGGWSLLNGYWKSSDKKFFLPVKMLSQVFRGKYLSLLKEARTEGKIKYPGKLQSLNAKTEFADLLSKLYKINWVVFCKKPFKSTRAVVEYLGRYTHRTAISNNRILAIENDEILFSWKDYRDKGKRKIMKLHYEEFIRRFLLHVLPKGFCRIRYYGIYANKNRKTKLSEYKKTMGIRVQKSKFRQTNWKEVMKVVSGKDVDKCPKCKNGTMNLYRILLPKSPT